MAWSDDGPLQLSLFISDVVEGRRVYWLWPHDRGAYHLAWWHVFQPKQPKSTSSGSFVTEYVLGGKWIGERYVEK